MLNKMNGCLASKPKVTLDVLVRDFVSQTNTKPAMPYYLKKKHLVGLYGTIG